MDESSEPAKYTNAEITKNMKDLHAAELIKIRLKYDWVILIYGVSCLLIQLFFPANLNFFFLVVGAFIFIEIFNLGIFRKLQQGGQNYFHMFSRISLDQDSTFGAVLFCIIFDLAVLFITSFVFWRDVLKQISI